MHGKNIGAKLETSISRDIRAAAEVEKIWILFDGDGNGKLDKQEVTDYIKVMAQPALQLEDVHMDEIFKLIDLDKDGFVDKKEMEVFLKTMMMLQTNLTFKKSNEFI